jgi:hypothetical protein
MSIVLVIKLFYTYMYSMFITDFFIGTLYVNVPVLQVM